MGQNYKSHGRMSLKGIKVKGNKGIGYKGIEE
jgi:hypothetical protein